MNLSLTTPRGVVVETDVDELVAPGSLGEFGILPGHVPFLSILRPGVLVYRNKGGARVVAVSEGVLEVARSERGERVLVLVDQAVGAKEIDVTAATQELSSLNAALARWKGDADGEYQTLVIRRDWAAARVEAAARTPAAH